MWISISVLMVVLGICDSFHLQNQPMVRRSVCRGAPPCCPGHVCRAYQRFDASRPVAVCARSVESRPLYAPGSQAQQRVCGLGSRSLPGGMGSVPPTSQRASRGLPQFRGSRTRGLDVSSLIGQPQTGIRQGIGREGSRFGPSSRLQWDQMRTQLPQRFQRPSLQMPGQNVRRQGQMGFPDFPPMPSFGDQSSQTDSFTSRLSPEQGLGQSSSFPTSLGQGQRSFGRIDEQRFDVGMSGRGQGQQDFLGQFSSGQIRQPADTGFEQGQSFGSQSFGDQSFRQSGGSDSLGGLSFGGGQSFSGGPSAERKGKGICGAGGGSAPQPFLIEQAPISATPIGGSQENNNNNNGLSQSQTVT
ncbi:filaggrin-2-like [Ruditapes philippinarum]|uniref:filaggrin-2-like n=1 Tax=Ruditapes philippinarum TaxID=129788 RepID=UPI00295A575F|nr:filaggrin-2-like [Ruditapes philippinarum]